MSDTRTFDAGSGDAPDMAAAELALGLLDGDERAGALRRVLAEPGFAREVERWRAHLAQFFDLWPGIEARREVFARIERSIDQPVAAAPTPASSARLWQGAAALSSIAAAGLLLFVVARPLPPRLAVPTPTGPVAPAPVLVASIAPDTKGAPVTAIYDPRAGALRLTEAALAEGDRTAQLWVITGDGVPHSLGLLPAKGGTALTVSRDNGTRLAAGSVLAISLEPTGGSPTGLPTGPVVAKGALAQV